jgi:predicted phosphohydrolase
MAWLAARPGRKVMSKGNHDYWWPKSQKKLTECIPEQTWALKKKALILPTTHGRLGILAVRGGDFAPLTKYGDNRTQATIDATLAKEIKELEASLNHLRELEQASTPCDATVCLFHYPPFPPGRDSSCFSELIHHSQARLCLYGHLHGEHVGDANVDGHHGTLRTRCVSCDQVDFALTDVTPWIW